MKPRIGSVVPCENVDPHTGSFLDYGVITGWIGKGGKSCARKDALGATIDLSGGRFAEWDNWAEEHAWRLDPFLGNES